MTDEIEGTAEPLGSELLPVHAPPSTLFRTDDPVRVLEEATRVAVALKKVIVDKKMTQMISGKEHVKVEGWQTLGAMLGVVPVVTWTRKIDHGWEARCEARTLDERVIGAGEMQCLDTEENWKDSDDYAIRSMAQTRAISKAMSGPLRFVVTLAGYSGTAAEEMPPGGFSSGRQGPSEKQKQYITTLARQKKATVGQLQLICDKLGAGVTVKKDDESWMDGLTRGEDGTASKLISFLKENPIPTGATDVPVDVEDFKPAQLEGGDTEPLPFEETEK